MTDWPRFPNAPITEALLDIRVALSPNVDLPMLASFQEGLFDRYPDRRERSSWQAGLQVGQGGGFRLAETSGGPDGYLFTSRDGRQIAQARLDGFTFNKLKPYDQWSSFRDEAKQLWDVYVKVAAPELITRVALRYINQINLPLPLVDFKDYILTAPEVAPKLPQALAGFFMRLVLPADKRQATAIVNETIKPPEGGVLPLIFDIDAHREVGLNPDDSEIWRALEDLREFKNEVFFWSLTDRAKELFQ